MSLRDLNEKAYFDLIDWDRRRDLLVRAAPEIADLIEAAKRAERDLWINHGKGEELGEALAALEAKGL